MDIDVINNPTKMELGWNHSLRLDPWDTCGAISLQYRVSGCSITSLASSYDQESLLRIRRRKLIMSIVQDSIIVDIMKVSQLDDLSNILSHLVLSTPYLSSLQVQQTLYDPRPDGFEGRAQLLPEHFSSLTTPVTAHKWRQAIVVRIAIGHIGPVALDPCHYAGHERAGADFGRSG